MIKLDFANLASKGSLRQLLDGVLDVEYSIRCPLGIHDLVVDNRADPNTHVVLRDAVLFPDWFRVLAQIVGEPCVIDERYKDVHSA
jgi:hypothetical protein